MMYTTNNINGTNILYILNMLFIFITSVLVSIVSFSGEMYRIDFAGLEFS